MTDLQFIIITGYLWRLRLCCVLVVRQNQMSFKFPTSMDLAIIVVFILSASSRQQSAHVSVSFHLDIDDKIVLLQKRLVFDHI